MDTEDMKAAAAERLRAALQDPALSWLGGIASAMPSAEWFLVGGAVRDALMGRDGRKDFDLVVRNADLDRLAAALGGRGRVDLVGRTFGVLKFWPEGSVGPAVDIAWPRTERAGMSGGYRDFAVQSDPELPIQRDLARRDFTMNAVAWDVRGAFVDPFGGIADIAAGTIRAVGDPRQRFAEDSSRMLRALRFDCELGFVIEPATWDALKVMMPRINDVRPGAKGDGERVVPYETVARELLKSLAADRVKAIDIFESSGALFAVIPELEPLARCAQSPDHHSEGDVWAHTKLAMAKLGGEEFRELFPGERPSVETALAVLLHDVAKPETAKRENGSMTFYGHSERGASIAKAIARRLRFSSVEGADVDAERLAWLVKMHLLPNLVDVDEVRKTTLVKHFLSGREAGRRLLHLACADGAASLRPDGSADLGTLRRLLGVLRELEERAEKAPAKLVSGEDVMTIAHVEPGPEVGKLLGALKEAQLRGEVSTVEQAREFLKKTLGA